MVRHRQIRWVSSQVSRQFLIFLGQKMQFYTNKTKVLFGLCMLCFAVGMPAAETDEGLYGPAQLIEALQGGGLIIYFRHGATDHSQDDQHPIDLSDCSTQRNLSEEGRQQAQRIGEAIKRLNIPIGEVLASPFCRCRDTAQLMFGRYRLDDALFYAVAVDKESRVQQSEHLLSLLSTPPPGDANKVIVSHTGNLREATGIWPKPEGAAWVFRPLGEGGYQALGLLDPDYWSNVH